MTVERSNPSLSLKLLQDAGFAWINAVSPHGAEGQGDRDERPDIVLEFCRGSQPGATRGSAGWAGSAASEAASTALVTQCREEESMAGRVGFGGADLFAVTAQPTRPACSRGQVQMHNDQPIPHGVRTGWAWVVWDSWRVQEVGTRQRDRVN